jgi:hypothetical protein
MSRRDGRDGLLLECGRLDYCVFPENGGRSDRLKGGMVLTSDLVLKKLRRILPSDLPYQARSSCVGLVAIATC